MGDRQGSETTADAVACKCGHGEADHSFPGGGCMHGWTLMDKGCGCWCFQPAPADAVKESLFTFRRRVGPWVISRSRSYRAFGVTMPARWDVVRVRARHLRATTDDPAGVVSEKAGSPGRAVVSEEEK